MANGYNYFLTHRPVKLKLGEYYTINNRKTIFRFIRTTRKGYNFLNIHTAKCLFRNHFYVSKYHKDKPVGENEFIFLVSDHIHFHMVFDDDK